MPPRRRLTPAQAASQRQQAQTRTKVVITPVKNRASGDPAFTKTEVAMTAEEIAAEDARLAEAQAMNDLRQALAEASDDADEAQALSPEYAKAVYERGSAELFPDADVDFDSLEDVLDCLFGPLAAANTPERRHVAAYKLYGAYQQATGTVDGITASVVMETVTDLHSDNGQGWCTGCGRADNGGLSTKLENCPTLIALLHLVGQVES